MTMTDAEAEKFVRSLVGLVKKLLDAGMPESAVIEALTSRGMPTRLAKLTILAAQM